jgi:hypothetical protein
VKADGTESTLAQKLIGNSISSWPKLCLRIYPASH